MGRKKIDPKIIDVKPHEFINWSRVSVYFTGSPNVIRYGRNSKKLDIFIKRLIKIMKLWLIITKPYSYKEILRHAERKTK